MQCERACLLNVGMLHLLLPVWRTNWHIRDKLSRHARSHTALYIHTCSVVLTCVIHHVLQGLLIMHGRHAHAQITRMINLQARHTWVIVDEMTHK